MDHINSDHTSTRCLSVSDVSDKQRYPQYAQTLSGNRCHFAAVSAAKSRYFRSPEKTLCASRKHFWLSVPKCCLSCLSKYGYYLLSGSCTGTGSTTCRSGKSRKIYFYGISCHWKCRCMAENSGCTGRTCKSRCRSPCFLRWHGFYQLFESWFCDTTGSSWHCLPCI